MSGGEGTLRRNPSSNLTRGRFRSRKLHREGPRRAYLFSTRLNCFNGIGRGSRDTTRGIVNAFACVCVFRIDSSLRNTVNRVSHAMG